MSLQCACLLPQHTHTPSHPTPAPPPPLPSCSHQGGEQVGGGGVECSAERPLPPLLQTYLPDLPTPAQPSPLQRPSVRCLYSVCVRVCAQVCEPMTASRQA